MPGEGRGTGSVHVDTNNGVMRTKVTSRSSSDWKSLNALAWARYTGVNTTIRKDDNVDTITRISAGRYEVILDDTLKFNSDDDFCVVAISSKPITRVVDAKINGNGTGSFTIVTEDQNSAGEDSGFISFVVYGETIQ